jgi:hypothetical protein
LKRADRQGPPIQDRLRYPQARTKLNPIPEALQDDVDIYSVAHDAFDDQLGQDRDDDMFEWDEPTLVAAMMDEESVPSEAHSKKKKKIIHTLSSSSPFDPNLQEIVAKANELQLPISSLSKQAKLDIIRSLVPAAKALQDAHRVLNAKIDPAFGDGFLGFDDSCQKIERAARKDQAEFVTTLDSALVSFRFTSSQLLLLYLTSSLATEGAVNRTPQGFLQSTNTAANKL